MSLNYVIVDGNKYIIDGKDIYKILDNKNIIPTKDELVSINNVIKNIGKDIFSSDILNSIAKENIELYKIDCLPEILKNMEDFIPSDYRDNLYNNLKTIKFNIEDPISIDTPEMVHENANHNPHNNTINLNKYSFSNIEFDSFSRGTDFYTDFKVILSHELLHLASFKKLSDGFYQGVCKSFDIEKPKGTSYDELKEYAIKRNECEKEYRIATSFNEGITDLYANILYYDDSCNFTEGYETEIRIISQLVYLIGVKSIGKAYFLNMGLDYIKYELCNIINSPDLFYELAENMGIINDLDNKKERDSAIIKIQNILLKYEKAHIENLYKKKDYDRINTIISETNANFVGYWKNMDHLDSKDRELADKNLELFNELNEYKDKKTYKK